MALFIIRDDITNLEVDAIVNAANTDLSMGSGVCGAIFRSAGVNKMQEACSLLSPIKTGEAVITPGFNLLSKYVIHTAGPIYDEKNPQKSRELLFSSYKNSLELATSKGLTSIAFPLISSGTYGYPKSEAIEVARQAIEDFLNSNDMDVYLVLHNKVSLEIAQSFLEDISKYIRENLKRDDLSLLEIDEFSELIKRNTYITYGSPPKLENILDNLDDSFSTTLMNLIYSKSKTDVEIYKKANLDRRLFSKIRSNPDYNPSKRTAIALALALELDLEKTNELLGKAGYTLSPSSVFDVIIEYFIVNENYDIFEINSILFEYDQPLLGS